MPDRTAAARVTTGASCAEKTDHQRRWSAPRALFAADTAFAAAYEPDQMQRIVIGDLDFDFRQRFFQLQTGAIKRLVCLLELRHLRRFEAGPPQSHQIQSLRFD